MALQRRQWMLRLAGFAALPWVGTVGRRAAAQQAEPQVVKLVAQRFQYTPHVFQVKVGQPVVLEFTALDFMHGFSLPDLKLRADLVPGQVTRLGFTVDKPGTYEFLCDNFCGEAHEDMNGHMQVTAD